ncbi:MAG: SGNH/GDSL hydrolase family protein [Myxococcota bacterium]|nr:SGNH/GDSL hydrolase family protein [Myxococcota bacterium]MEC9390253.1 SGNH/GDSL hydrolase family protein [Myxococcota bacterium]
MSRPFPIHDNTVRGFLLGAIVSWLLLAGAERAAVWIETTHLADPAEPGAFDPPHPHLLWELPPGETVVNGQQITVNRVGARGPEIRQPKPQNVRRILFLGGQTMFGQGVDLEDTFAFDAVDNLGGARVGLEPVMMAVPDYTALQNLNLMDLRGWSLEPDLLVVSGPAAEMSVQPYVDAKVLAPVVEPDGPRAALQRFAMFRVLDRWANLNRNDRAKERHAVFLAGDNRNPSGALRMSTNAYATSLDRLALRAIERGIPVVFVLMPVIEDLSEQHLTDTVHLYRNAMNVVARRHGIPVIDGAAVFRASNRQTGQLFLNPTLLTRRGHRALGYALTKAIKPWMRGRAISKPGTGEPLGSLPEPEPMTDAL